MSFLVPSSQISTQTHSVFVEIKAEFQIIYNIPDRFSTPISASTSTDPGNHTPLISSAENPREIANLFNSYFASVFPHDSFCFFFCMAMELDSKQQKAFFPVQHEQENSES